MTHLAPLVPGLAAYDATLLKRLEIEGARTPTDRVAARSTRVP